MDHHAPVSVTDAPAPDGAMRRMTLVAVLVAAALVTGKLVAWLMTGSVAILGSAIDSAIDVMASLVNLLAVRQALQPADAEHRFGHGKAEALAALFQAVLITASAVFLAHEAIGKVQSAVPLDNGAVAIGVMLVSIVVTGLLVMAQRRVARASGSLAIKADSVHYSADVAQNLGVIAAIALSAFGGLAWADPVIGLGIAALLLWGAWGVMSNAYDELMDREWPEDERERIRAIVCAHPGVHSFHELRTRRSGVHAFIQFHIELDGEMTLSAAHKIAADVEAELAREFPRTEILIHQDPVGLKERVRRF